MHRRQRPCYFSPFVFSPFFLPPPPPSFHCRDRFECSSPADNSSAQQRLHTMPYTAMRTSHVFRLMKTFSEFDSVSGEKKTMPIGSQKDLARMYICNNLFLFTPGFSHEIFIMLELRVGEEITTLQRISVSR